MHRLKISPSSPLLRWMSWAFIGLGIILRLRQYAFNKSIWLDEAALILNIINRPFAGLFQPLDTNQGAPVGFLLAVKTLVTGLGQSEYVLRLFPFLASIAALFLFYRVVRQVLHPYLVPAGVLFMALSDRLVYYAAEAKQYSVDVAIVLALIWMGLEFRARGLTPMRMVLYALAGAAAVWFSHPAVFVLAGIGLYFFLSFAAKKEWPNLLRISLVGLAWGGSLLAEYFISLKDLGQNELLVAYWSGSFLPFPPASLADLSWYARAFFAAFKDPFATPWPELCALVFLLGAFTLAKKEKRFFWLLVSALPFMLAASALRKYPLSGRLILFLVPVFILGILKGIEYVSSLSARWFAAPGILLAVFLLAPQLVSAGKTFAHPTTMEEIRPVIQYMLERRQPGESIYVYYAANYAFEYYSAHYGIDPNYKLGLSSRPDPSQYLAEVDEWIRPGRAWLIFTHVHVGKFGDEREIILDHLNRSGELLDSFYAPGALVYLYQIRPVDP